VPAAIIPNNENERLDALYELVLLDTPMEERFDTMTQMAVNIFNVDFAAIVFIDKDRQWVKSSSLGKQWHSPRAESICAHTILHDDITLIEDLKLSANCADLPNVIEGIELTFYAGIALKSPSGQNIATLCIGDLNSRTLGQRERTIMRQLATVVESKLHNTSQLQITQQLLKSERKLNVATQALKDNERLTLLRNHTLELLATSKPLRAVLLSIVEGVEQQFPQMTCSILLLDDKTRQFYDGVAPSLPDFYNQAIKTLVIGDGVGSCGTAAFTKQRVIVEDIKTHPYWLPYAGLAQQAGLEACWSEPILNANGNVLGTFAIYHDRPNVPSELELRLIEQSAYLASIVIEHDNAEKLIWRQANYDYLTGLANRQLFAELVSNAIKRSRRKQQNFSLLFLDLDRFKAINDNLGHVMGDRLLIECAHRLTQCVRESDNVARLGGDEFVVLLNDIPDREITELIASKIQRELDKPFTLDENIVHISVSIGITDYPDDGLDYDTLLNNADQAMYQAKSNGRDCFEHFNPGMSLAKS